MRDLPLTAFPSRAGSDKDEPMISSTRRVAVIGGNRIPFARSNTVYATASNQDMLTAAIDGAVTRFGLEGERLGEVHRYRHKRSLRCCTNQNWASCPLRSTVKT